MGYQPATYRPIPREKKTAPAYPEGILHPSGLVLYDKQAFAEHHTRWHESKLIWSGSHAHLLFLAPTDARSVEAGQLNDAAKRIIDDMKAIYSSYLFEAGNDPFDYKSVPSNMRTIKVQLHNKGRAAPVSYPEE